VNAELEHFTADLSSPSPLFNQEDHSRLNTLLPCFSEPSKEHQDLLSSLVLAAC
jgi:hypothetical protein